MWSERVKYRQKYAGVYLYRKHNVEQHDRNKYKSKVQRKLTIANNFLIDLEILSLIRISLQWKIRPNNNKYSADEETIWKSNHWKKAQELEWKLNHGRFVHGIAINRVLNNYEITKLAYIII